MLKKTVREHKVLDRRKPAVAGTVDTVPPSIVISEKMLAAANKSIADTFTLFSDTAERLKGDVDAFETTQKKNRATISRGARRTDGRII